MSIHAAYDCIIVGAGISGLTAGLHLKKKHPSWSVAILERYKGLGGRAYSYSPPGFPGVHWEMGAGRIPKSHKMSLDLLKHYGLHLQKIESPYLWKATGRDPIVPNYFDTAIIPMYIEPLQSLSQDILSKNTIYSLWSSLYGKRVAHELGALFAYWSELRVLRADLGVSSFVKGSMAAKEEYSVVKEGFSYLIEKMRQDFVKAGGIVLQRHHVIGVQSAGGSKTDIDVLFGRKEDEFHGRIQLRANRACILALHSDALREIQGIKSMPQLSLVKTEPLFRIYAIFPTPAWFEDLGNVITKNRAHFIIPVNPKKGVIMISYTEGPYTNAYYKIQKEGGDKALEKAVMSDIRKLFPDRTIPDPLFFRGHHWITGTTYWLPGSYAPAEESKKACHPLPKELPGVYVCNESFSMCQAWIQGSLEHTAECMKILDSSIKN